MVRHLFQQHHIRHMLLKEYPDQRLSPFPKALCEALLGGQGDVVEVLLSINTDVPIAEAFEAAMDSLRGSKLIMTKLLLAHGLNVNLKTLKVIADFNIRIMEGNKSWTQGRPTTDEVRTAILLGLEIKKHLPRKRLPYAGHVSTVCAKVTQVGFPGPLEPIFYTLAEEVDEWIKHVPSGEEIDQRFKKLRLAH
ncbi:hypothetical protein K491DRAFT_715250 [Lophiostoma macrostomum CBS 122681]|uniref:Ankyrin n=1 Tax=Lophiostoma macrostomum CBS 122681 TaxID=1314788 RepID=A0A6A6TA36_9PLEO|nr:hypothetical protein K491DRAFT_715250 [Lophiostoma macrostomum CBS 122681]